MELNLTAKTREERIVLDYLKKNVSEILGEKINAGKKTLAECWAYITSEARKEAKNGCACIEDSKVFGWAVHFFEEDSITANVGSARVIEEAPKEKNPSCQSKKKQAPDSGDVQLSLF